MVGCGALGCEYLKNFALVGIAHGEGGGTLTVTDNDAVSVSNLNRQVLFRSDNVDTPKSVAASTRVLAMNPFLNVKALKELVCVKTENIFDDAFWNAQVRRSFFFSSFFFFLTNSVSLLLLIVTRSGTRSHGSRTRSTT